jgi:DNA-binding MarR family transcriptional regulator
VDAERTERQEISKCLFGQVHRLDVMLAIANAPGGVVTATDLANELHLPQSALQAPLRDLLTAGLLVRDGVRESRKVYRRLASKGWEWAVELDGLAKAQERRARVRPIKA